MSAQPSLSRREFYAAISACPVSQLRAANEVSRCHRLSFTQGFILGQISIVLLLAAFIKFFIFGDAPSPEVTASLRATERQSRTLAHKKSLLSLRESNSRQPGQPPALNKKKSSILRPSPP